jgi:glycerate-2-kinase
MLFKNQEQLVSNGRSEVLQRKRRDALEILAAAVDAVDPYRAVRSRFEDNNRVDVSKFTNVYVVGFGKASIGMTQAVLDFLPVSKGVVVTNDPHAKLDDTRVKVVVGGHPLPTNGSIKGAEKIVRLVEQCKQSDVLLVLISGGGSALMCMPRVSLESLQQTTDLLLRSGADINEINTIRKHLSYVKGGQLVKQATCRVISFVISDIVDDPLEFIASGSTVPDSTTFLDAQRVLEKYALWSKIPDEVKCVIEDGIARRIPETPKKDDPIFDEVTNSIVANNRCACTAAQYKAEELGYNAMILTSSLTGEAKNIGTYLVEKARSYQDTGKKNVFIAGGETTVTVKGSGRGGRNQEMVLGAIEALANSDMVFASFATDGCDGNCDAAGAIADGFTSLKADEKNLDRQKFLNDNNSYAFFADLKDTLITGPTGTNVMDIQVIVL